MDDVVLVHVLQGNANLFDVLANILLLQRPMLNLLVKILFEAGFEK
jgi:hypothetical protein